MLTLTRKTEYALIAVCHLAHEQTAVISARDIAEAHGMPLPLLMNVLKLLNQAGIVNSVRGAKGGYLLKTSPNELTLEALIEAVEGPVHLVRCTNPEHESKPCTLVGPCPIRSSVRRVHERLRQLLGTITIAEFMFHGRPLGAETGMKVIAT